MIYDPAKIKELRLQRRWSQTELARRARLSQPTISAVERGEEHVKAQTLERLARALGVPQRVIMKADKAQPKELEGQKEEAGAIFDALDDQTRRAWLAAGRAFLDSKGRGSKS